MFQNVTWALKLLSSWLETYVKVTRMLKLQHSTLNSLQESAILANNGHS